MHNFKVRFIKVHLCMIAVHDRSKRNRVVLANNTLLLLIEICFTYATIAI